MSEEPKEFYVTTGSLRQRVIAKNAEGAAKKAFKMMEVGTELGIITLVYPVKEDGTIEMEESKARVLDTESVVRSAGLSLIGKK